MKTKSVIAILTGFLLLLIKSTFAQSNQNPFDDKLVIVIHVQDHFTKYVTPEDSTADFIKNINKIIESANPENVIYVKMIHTALFISFKKIKIDSIPFPGGSGLDNRLSIVNQNIFDDIKFDIFKSENLKNVIGKKSINEIVVVGRLAEEGISKTALSGKENGYKMYYVSDAILGKSVKSKTKKLNKLKNKGVRELFII